MFDKWVCVLARVRAWERECVRESARGRVGAREEACGRERVREDAWGCVITHGHACERESIRSMLTFII